MAARCVEEVVGWRANIDGGDCGYVVMMIGCDVNFLYVFV